VYERLISLRRHGLQGKRIPYGYNSLISEDHAAQLNLLLDKFDSLQAKRTKIAERYFKNLPYEEFIRSNKNTTSSYHKLVILHDKREHLQQYLATHGIETKIHYTNALDTAGSYPEAEKICKRALSLPIYPYLSLSEVDYICERINRFNGV
jgi:dTDP-4-amino-4,6-dideoxygalactose transaminase